MYLAELNIAHGKWDIEAPGMADFKNNVDDINALAEAQEGFIWRFQDDDGDAMSNKAFNEPNLLVNMSIWKDKASLFNYVYNTQHTEFLKRKKEWFHHIKSMSMVLWYVDKSHIPTLIEAKSRLEYLQKHGETPYAFSFKGTFSEAEAKAFQS